jgi:hypothetical protein
MNIVIADTETIGLWPKHIYDFGYIIQDRKGNTLFESSYLIEEVITDANKMMGAFYAKKLFTHYLPLVDAGMISIKPFSEVYDEFIQATSDFNVDVLSAYNLGFDLRAIRETKKFLGYKNFLQGDYKLLDIWQFACEVLLNRPTYKKLADQQKWISAKGNYRTNAEVTHNYITGNIDGVEAHTALCDARLEGEILKKCFQQHKKIPYGKIDKSPWRIVNAT